MLGPEGNPEAELSVAFSTIGPVMERFVAVEDIFEPINDGSANGIFITSVRLKKYIFLIYSPFFIYYACIAMV